MKLYVKSNAELGEVPVIKSVQDMTNFIQGKGLINTAIDWANDTDKSWEYDTPETFSDYSAEWLKKLITEMVDDGDIETVGDPISLISDEIWNELREQASSGDFDDDYESYYKSHAVDFNVPNKPHRDMSGYYADLTINELTKQCQNYITATHVGQSSNALSTIMKLIIKCATAFKNDYPDSPFVDDCRRFLSSSREISDVEKLLNSFPKKYRL